MKLAEKQALNPSLADPSQYQIDVTITRCEKGNTFAHGMPAGLGQMHPDGPVKYGKKTKHVGWCLIAVTRLSAFGPSIVV